jgi:heat shock protein HtpX
MLVAMFLCALMLVGLALVLGYVLFESVHGWAADVFLVSIAVGGYLAGRRQPWIPWRQREPTAADRARMMSAVARIALIADMQPPSVDVRHGEAPLSWTTAFRRHSATVHVTTGLLDRVNERELDAVVAHEFGHLLQRDAIVMTALTGPPSYFLTGLREMANDDVRGLFFVIVYGPFLATPAALMLSLARIVSRHRELSADRAAALITGSPAAVSAALVAVDDGLRALPKRDLRVAVGRESLHFVPVNEPRFFRRIRATHPTVAKRLARLERLEVALHRR